MPNQHQLNSPLFQEIPEEEAELSRSYDRSEDAFASRVPDSSDDTIEADETPNEHSSILPSKRANVPEKGISDKKNPVKRQKTDKKRESSIVKKLIEELTAEKVPDTNITSPSSQATSSDSIDFVRLYNEIVNAETHNVNASQNVIRAYFSFGKGLLDRLNYYKKSNRERASLILVNNEVREQLSK
ncbi:9212_t:CDS:1, partial [Paraglomus brasilianum]